MAEPLADLISMPHPQIIEAGEGVGLATYTWGDPDAPVVLLVHGFASSTRDNWVLTGWVSMLQHAGYRVLGIDQRGHGASEKPRQPSAYTMRTLAADIEQVLDTYLVDEAVYVGYSLGARVGWDVLRDLGDRVQRAVLGGIPDGRPLERLDVVEARAYIAERTPVSDPSTRDYIALTERVSGNDLEVMLALALGMRGEARTIDPDPATAPAQPLLFATGSDDPIIEGSRRLAAAAPHGAFIEVPGRHHFNAPGSTAFREAALQFLRG